MRCHNSSRCAPLNSNAAAVNYADDGAAAFPVFMEPFRRQDGQRISTGIT
jgi:hypothetical protein